MFAENSPLCDHVEKHTSNACHRFYMPSACCHKHMLAVVSVLSLITVTACTYTHTDMMCSLAVQEALDGNKDGPNQWSGKSSPQQNLLFADWHYVSPNALKVSVHSLHILTITCIKIEEEHACVE